MDSHTCTGMPLSADGPDRTSPDGGGRNVVTGSSIHMALDLDSPNFDPLAFLNDVFPSEQSLSLLDPETGMCCNCSGLYPF